MGNIRIVGTISAPAEGKPGGRSVAERGGTVFRSANSNNEALSADAGIIASGMQFQVPHDDIVRHFSGRGCKIPRARKAPALGPVDIHLEAVRAATRFQLAAWLQFVLPYRVAIPLNFFILAKWFSTRCRHLPMGVGIFGSICVG